MTAPLTIIILIVTGITTFVAFRRPDLQDRWIFNPYAILRHKEYERMLTSGLIHADWLHFGFNAFSFYSFGQNIEILYGWTSLLFVYVSAILGGSLLSLVIHRHHDYRALGASGGVCGVIFASIFLLPGSGVMLFLIPIGIPAYIYAPLFLVISFFAHRKQIGNIGHDAHLGGAIVGLLVATAMYPELMFAQPWLYALVVGLSVAILMVLIFDPLGLWKARFAESEARFGGERERRYSENRNRSAKFAEVDRLLDKVAAQGLQSLSEAERKRLEQLSKEVGNR